MTKIEAVPRFWPILYSIFKSGKIDFHFFLQKYIYLAKREGKAKIGYVFEKYDFGPYCRLIKADTVALQEQNLIDIYSDYGGHFSVHSGAENNIKTILESVPKKELKIMDAILEKYKGYSVSELKKYIYSKYVKRPEDIDLRKQELVEESGKLLGEVKKMPKSKNSLTLEAALDYSKLLLLKENFKDVIKKEIIVSSVDDLFDKIENILTTTKENPSTLECLDIVDVEEDFEIAQAVSDEFGVLPSLAGDETDLNVFIENI
ncbi:MAG: DUF4065 domain-containing protein [Candidatus Diapherotrites archaeon]|nr:DUF4065 domain-containing protein [Candidatus Diapherotrites archaeon]